MSTGPAQAHTIVAEFDAQTGPGAFRMDRGAIAQRLHELVDSPDAIRQGRLNLCGPAALFRVWLRRDPVAAVTYATSLFDRGRSRIGPVQVRPSRALRELRYGRTERGASCPPADWLMMAALRDSTNRFVRYSRAGGPIEAAAAITMPAAVRTWLAATGLFSEVRDETTLVWRKSTRHAYELSPAPDRELLLLVALEMFRHPTSLLGRVRDRVVSQVPNHWVVLTGPVTYAKDSTSAPRDGAPDRIHGAPDDAVVLRFWSWGAEHTAVLPEFLFRRCYHGSLTALATAV
jgi:hypothetical protein